MGACQARPSQIPRLVYRCLANLGTRRITCVYIPSMVMHQRVIELLSPGTWSTCASVSWEGIEHINCFCRSIPLRNARGAALPEAVPRPTPATSELHQVPLVRECVYVDIRRCVNVCVTVRATCIHVCA